MSPRGKKPKLKPEVTAPEAPPEAPMAPGPEKQVAPEPTPPVKGALPPPEPGHKYFEAPDGVIMLGAEADSKVWYPKMGIFILPKR